MEFLWKSAVVLSLFFLVYKIFLERETFFRSIRIYLMLGSILSFILPFITIKRYVTVKTQQALLVTQREGNLAEQAAPAITMEQALLILYLLGAVFFLGRFLIQLGTLSLFLWRNPKMRQGRYIMMPTTKKMSPFSFFNFKSTRRRPAQHRCPGGSIAMHCAMVQSICLAVRQGDQQKPGIHCRRLRRVRFRRKRKLRISIIKNECKRIRACPRTYK